MGLNVYQYYKDAPPAGKIVIIGVGAFAAIAAYYAIRSAIKKIQQQKDLKGQREAVEDSKMTVQVLQQQGKGPTYPPAQYSAWASAIEKAFDGCDPMSDDMAAIANAINAARTEADLYELISTFGVRTWDKCGWGTGDEKANLPGGVRLELNQAQINTLNTILRNKGIVYQF